MNSTISLSDISTTTINNNDDINGSLADDWEHYRAYTKFYYITDEVFLYANPILIIIGIPTHALSMIIFLRKRMRRYPVSVFMAMLSLTNILILAGPVTMQWLNHKVFIGFVVTGSRFLCAFHVYIDLVGSSINSWLILMIAVERYLSVTKPFLIRTNFNRQQAWTIVFSVFLVAIIAPLGLAIVASKVDDCLLFFSKTYQIIGSIQIFFIYVLPSILILTLSIITVHKLRNRIRTRGSRRIHISVMLIAVSFSFITFTMPYQVCWYWLFSTAIGSVKLNLKVNIINIGFRYIALTIRNLNYTLNFFLYSLTSIVFLKEAFTIAHCNYFLNQTFAERNHAFRRVRRFLSEHGGGGGNEDQDQPDQQEQQEQQQQQQQQTHQQINGLNRQTDQPYDEHHHFPSFKRHFSIKRKKSDPLDADLSKTLLNGHLNIHTSTTNVSYNLKQNKPISFEKNVQCNLTINQRTVIPNDANYLQTDNNIQQATSSNYSSMSNIQDLNMKVQL
ncbi:unnamed protein product [Adineta ricciae]|uniref:G-protein coupled receptors family 1 profile domain-containing protein n=2 Tax=Adineta ricciae TaxID=249248 RepID=A0A815DU50_ADIRI|nr:unnamed protein product [Adineta ricciae]